MTIKKYINKFAIALLATVTLFSCSEDKMDEINQNPNNPTEVASNLVLADLINRTAVQIANGDFAFYASLYVEHFVGTHNQFFQAEIRDDGQLTVSSTYNNSWNGAYTALRDSKDVIRICSEEGHEAGNTSNAGIAQVLMAYNLAILTDMCGDVPWSEALDPDEHMLPHLDKQEDIYKEIFLMIDDAIINLETENNYANIGMYDILYQGQLDLWVKFAHGLKARLLMRQSHIDASVYDQVLEEIKLSFADASEEAKYLYNGGSTINPYALLWGIRRQYGASKSMHDMMTTNNDPRLERYFIPNDHADVTELVLGANGQNDQNQNLYGMSDYFNDRTYPTQFLSFHELKFLEAEALERKGQSGAEAATAAIKAAFIYADMEEGAQKAEDYIATIDNLDIDRIMAEKYISSYQSESIEAYNDFRRLKAMNGGNHPSYVHFLNPKVDKFPLRYTYGADDVNNNANVREAYQKVNVYTDNVWWAGGQY
ncbi:SusD/RagB family nutrient-binding outer membrane lipoprotein [Flammeovirga sp. MY04]|uniref:SusD/RagB family nutrient-binding outer membrane lipoprotein n=1 Tax=Flammeovirga sp. MY04 TaxID=1191459 RepID=UPI0008061CA5|nr:SusD/RagB family nutrient-binding outer membrane lipoprotein [Flammeovirga sp. MY04]ANQ50703.1 SusD/RagB family nutrient-binding outer membrane lipoprotein [Flammeovirga sp. MY04]